MDTAVRVTVNNRLEENRLRHRWCAAVHHFHALSPSAWLLQEVEKGELNGEITTSVTCPQQIHTTHSSLNPNVITFTTFESSINQQEHSD